MSCRRISLLLATVALALLATACGSGDDDDATPTPGGGTPAASPSSSASPAPTPKPTQIPLATQLARSAEFAVYLVSEGDTWDSIGTLFGVPSPTLKADNQTQAATPTPGSLVGIRMLLTIPGSIFPEASLQRALPGVIVFRPTQALRGFYLDRIILHNVIVHDGNPASEGVGYSMVYWLADRPAFKGGSLDPEAKAVELLFAVTAGLGAPSTTVPTIHRFTRDGVQYTVQTGEAAKQSPAEIAAMLEPVPLP
ncbi:MAG: hypothetical protein HY875_13360 [Chloroflexi bacterium]|nr:hypothetical protein [Chloroflexota bacterium]